MSAMREAAGWKRERDGDGGEKLVTGLADGGATVSEEGGCAERTSVSLSSTSATAVVQDRLLQQRSPEPCVSRGSLGARFSASIGSSPVEGRKGGREREKQRLLTCFCSMCYQIGRERYPPPRSGLLLEIGGLFLL